MTTAFPLLRLPYLVLMPVLEQMEFMDRIALSILSKRARMFLKLLKMKCNHINLSLEGERISMNVFFDNSKELTLDMYANYCTRIRSNYEYDYHAFWSCTLPYVDYVLPIMDVTHCKSIKTLTFPELSIRDPKYDPHIPLLTKLPKIDELIVEHTTSWSFSPESPLLKVLRIIFPVTSAVTISDQVRKPKYLREVFKGNFDAVSLCLPWNIEGFPLNDWKFTNAKTLKLDGPAVEIEDLNRYFKLWMKKESNPRLENLVVQIHGNITKDLLLKGLNPVQVPIRTDVKLLRSDEEITFEFDITRADGRTATIRISNLQIVYFYVWPIRQSQSMFMRAFSFISTFYNSCIKHFK